MQIYHYLKSLQETILPGKAGSRESSVIFYSMLITLVIFLIILVNRNTDDLQKNKPVNASLFSSHSSVDAKPAPLHPPSPFGRVVVSHSPRDLFASDERFVPFDFRKQYSRALSTPAQSLPDNPPEAARQKTADEDKSYAQVQIDNGDPLQEHLNYLSSGVHHELEHHIEQAWKLALELNREQEAITALSPLTHLQNQVIANFAREAINSLSEAAGHGDSHLEEYVIADNGFEESVEVQTEENFTSLGIPQEEYNESLDSLLQQATGDADPQQRLSAIKQIGSRMISSSLAPLETIAFSDPVAENRIQAITGLTDLAIAQIQAAHISQTLNTLANDNEENVATSAREALHSLSLANEQTASRQVE